MTTPNLEAILRRVQGLMAVAGDPATTPEAAESYRERAEALMFKYRIDEATLKASGAVEAASLRPQWRTFIVGSADSEFRGTYRTLAAAIISHCGLRAVWGSQYVDAEDTGARHLMAVVEAVGYESDLAYADMLMASVFLEFGKRLEPKYDAALSDAQNAYAMRSAGWEGHRIAQAIYGRTDKPLRVKVRRLFKEEAERRGEDPSALLGRGVNVAGFRRSYADGFADEFWSRLYRMRSVRGADERAVVLASRDKDIEEAYYERFPHLRPTPVERGAVATSWTECAKCKAAKSGFCREHSFLRPTRQIDRTNYAGVARGRQAARSVDLGPTGTSRVAGAGQRAVGQ